MQLGMVGLGRMGGNMVERIRRYSGHRVVAFDQSEETAKRAREVGVACAHTLEELVASLSGSSPRVVWVMVPAGSATDSTIEALAGLLSPGDIIVDGGNSRWSDDVERYGRLRAQGIGYVDVGTSGGIHGLRNGYCMMVGGDKEHVAELTPILEALAPPYGDGPHGPGWLHVGQAGAGHYVKMVHNGIEYGMMRALGEGFALFNASQYDLDLAAIAHLFMQGSIIKSDLVGLAANALETEGNSLAALEPIVKHSGEGQWTVEEAMRLGVPVHVIAASLFARFDSQDGGDFASKLVAALRNQFGGHAVTRKT